MTLFKGHHTTKIHGKTIIGIPNGLVGGLLYQNGTPFTGTSNGLYYVNGTTFTGYTNNNYYNGGTTITSDGSRTWTTLNPGMSSASIVALDDGNVLFCGGKLNNTYYNNCKIYNPISGSFSTAASMPIGRHRMTLIKLTNGKIAAIGGFNNIDNCSQSFLYDPTNDSWSTSMTVNGAVGVGPRRYFGCSLVPGTNKVLVTGGEPSNSAFGQNENNSLNRGTWLLDFDAGTVTAKADIPVTRSRHTTTFLSNGKLMLVGGYGSNNMTSYLYDLDTDSWTNIAPFYNTAPFGTFANLCQITDGRVVVKGMSTGSQILRIYNPTLNTWTPSGKFRLDPMPGGLLPGTVQNTFALHNNQVLLAGGLDTANDNLFTVFDVDNNTLSGFTYPYPNIPNPWSGSVDVAPSQNFHTVLLSNNLLIAGPFNTNGESVFGVCQF